MQAARADILAGFVFLLRGLRQRVQRGFLKVQMHVIDGQQRLVLAGQRVIRLAQNRLEILAGQRLQIHAHRETSLQFGNEIRHLRHMERARRDKEHVIRLDHAVFRVHRLCPRRSAECRAARLRGSRPARLVERPATLSISSMKMMPSCSARRSASSVTASMSISLSSFLGNQQAACVGDLHAAHLRLLGIMSPIIEPMFTLAPLISTSFGASSTSTSISMSFQLAAHEAGRAARPPSGRCAASPRRAAPAAWVCCPAARQSG